MLLTFLDTIKVEPYWNVNLIHLLNYALYYIIKVEPYWNVNIFFITYHPYS